MIGPGSRPGWGRDLCIRQRSLQNFTWSQTRSHFLRQVKGRPQVAQGFSGRCCLLTPFTGLGWVRPVGLVWSHSCRGLLRWNGQGKRGSDWWWIRSKLVGEKPPMKA